MDQYLTGRIRASLDKPGLRKTNQSAAGRIRSPQDEPGPHSMNRGPAGRFRAPQDEPEPRDESGSLRTDQGSAGPLRYA